MPYRSNAELPESVKGPLPALAQDIYRAAFNSAWRGAPVRTADHGTARDATAHKVAWAAVRQRFEQVGELWRPRH